MPPIRVTIVLLARVASGGVPKEEIVETGETLSTTYSGMRGERGE